MTKRGRYWQRWLVKWERSGLTQAEFCRRHGLKAVNFGWWKRKLGEPAEPLRPMVRRRRGRSSAEFVEFALPESSTASSRCSSGYEMILPRGVVIRLPVDFDSDRVAQLITAAASAC
jgi:hypothetical protein